MSRQYEYSVSEEKLNILSHALGLLLSIVGLVLLVIRASVYGNIWHVVSFTIFGVSLIILYAASTLYHAATEPALRRKLNIIDHIAIYILIAGSYTPFTLVTLNGVVGWIIFGITWGFAIIGIVLKLFYTGKFEFISTLMYVFMGWMIVFAIKPMIANLSSAGLYWLVAGGLAYTGGAAFYLIEKIKYNHTIFHVFVLLGSFCHFISVYYYVLEV